MRRQGTNTENDTQFNAMSSDGDCQNGDKTSQLQHGLVVKENQKATRLTSKCTDTNHTHFETDNMLSQLVKNVHHYTKYKLNHFEKKTYKRKSKKWFIFGVFLMMILSTECRYNSQEAEKPCLTGIFTDVQDWIYTNGSLSENLDSSISLDMSNNPSAVDQLRLLVNYYGTYPIEASKNEDLKNITIENLERVVYLSFARNNLYRIPLFSSSSSGAKTFNFTELRYLSFYGNPFGSDTENGLATMANYNISINATDYNEITENLIRYNDKSNWASDLQNIKMDNLLELDLRKCGIGSLENFTFSHLQNLRRLYLSQNCIQVIFSNAFHGLSNLVHLDLSHNAYVKSRAIVVDEDPTTDYNDIILLEKWIFSPLRKLKSLDFSGSKIVASTSSLFMDLPLTLIRLSICHTKFQQLTSGFFSSTSMQYLDLSGNMEILTSNALRGIEKNLTVLYANRIGIKNTDWIENFRQIRVVSLIGNDITTLTSKHFEKLLKLEVLDVMNNRISNWNIPVFTNFKHVEFLRLAGNNLNLMTYTMLNDLRKVRFLSVSNNKFVCNCGLKEFVLRGIQSAQEEIYIDDFLTWSTSERDKLNYNNATYTEISETIHYMNIQMFYRDVIEQRINVSAILGRGLNILERRFLDARRKTDSGNVSTIFIDYLDQKDICIDSRTSRVASYSNITCDANTYDDSTSVSTWLTVGLVIMALVIVLTALAFWKWWYIRYFFMMIKNAAILSVMGNSDGTEDEEKVFTYDVFVSYCDEDRKWVLEHLLPEVEQNTAVSICLHERDFQVGLSILENIISSMDRSRVLMMVVSSQFLLSQWCQFEMHLAQHRLLETRREQLILVLLEDIPRRKRPNTLHYLMMTKTYIVWPADKPSDQAEFWKRLKKALMHGKCIDRCSTA